MKPLKFDLHIHSIYSDGIGSPEDIVKQAKAMNLAGIAVTDHDTVKGLIRARKEAEKQDIILIEGVEITTPMGDIISLGINKMPFNNMKNKTPIEIIDKIHDMNGIAALAHPFGGYWPVSFAEMIDMYTDKFDAIEILNAFTPMDANIEAMRMAKKIKLPGIGGSDAHSLEMVGAGFTEIKKGDVLEAIRKGTTSVGWL